MFVLRVVPLRMLCYSRFRQKRLRPMTKQPTLTKADLIEEVLRVTELPRKESETIVETIFESIIDALQKATKSKSAASAVSAPASAAGAWEGTPRPARRWRCRRRRFPSSNPARNSRTSSTVPRRLLRRRRAILLTAKGHRLPLRPAQNGLPLDALALPVPGAGDAGQATRLYLLRRLAAQSRRRDTDCLPCQEKLRHSESLPLHLRPRYGRALRACGRATFVRPRRAAGNARTGATARRGLSRRIQTRWHEPRDESGQGCRRRGGRPLAPSHAAPLDWRFQFHDRHRRNPCAPRKSSDHLRSPEKSPASLAPILAPGTPRRSRGPAPHVTSAQSQARIRV